MRAVTARSLQQRTARHPLSRPWSICAYTLIIERVIEATPSGVQGEFDTNHTLRPATNGEPLSRCLHGHDLQVAGSTLGWAPGIGLTTQTCSACWALRTDRATWCLVDPGRHHCVDDAPDFGFTIVRLPPATPRGGVGQLQVRVDGQAIGDTDIAVCTPCRRGVLEHIRVDHGHTHHGYGRVLVAAAAALAPDVSWSTTTINRDPVAIAFWAAVADDWPGSLGTPVYCSDMIAAAEHPL